MGIVGWIILIFVVVAISMTLHLRLPFDGFLHYFIVCGWPWILSAFFYLLGHLSEPIALIINKIKEQLKK